MSAATITPTPTPTAPRSELRAERLKKRYGARTVVHDVHVAVAAGEVVGLLGPNGAGKTTSFYMIVGLVPADAGEISIDGQRVEHLPAKAFSGDTRPNPLARRIDGRRQPGRAAADHGHAGRKDRHRAGLSAAARRAG